MSPAGDRQARQSVIDTALKAISLGINHGAAGNFSRRVEGGFLITPSGIAYERLRPEQIVFVDFDGNAEGAWLQSSEWRMHRDIYSRHEAAGAVIHVHSTHATALACLRRPIPAFHYMVAVAGGRDIRCADYATFGTAELSSAMLAALDGRRACLLGNHGQVCFHDSLDEALTLAIEIEALASQYLAALAVGEPVIIDDAEMDRVIAKFGDYGRQPAAVDLPE